LASHVTSQKRSGAGNFGPAARKIIPGIIRALGIQAPPKERRAVLAAQHDAREQLKIGLALADSA